MRASRDTAPDEFVPFRLNILIESREEAQAMYAIFNLVHNAKLLDGKTAECIRRLIGQEYSLDDSASRSNDVAIANGFPRSQYYRMSSV